MNINKIAELVKNNRKYASLSRNALAELAGVGKTAIYDIEHGNTNFQMQTLLKIFNVLNINIKLHSPLDIKDN